MSSVHSGAIKAVLYEQLCSVPRTDGFTLKTASVKALAEEKRK